MADSTNDIRSRLRQRGSAELRTLLDDCGGIRAVAERLGMTPMSVWEWMQRGHLPLSDVTGRTRYAEVLAKMQRRGKRTPTQIRRIGLRV